MTDKTAILTGGSRGIGRNTAINLSRRCADIIFTYHSNRRDAESLIGEIEANGKKATALRLDVGDTFSFDGFVDIRRRKRHPRIPTQALI